MSKTESRIIAAFAEMREKEAAAKALASEIASLKSELTALIPPGEARAGVAHRTRPHTSVSYAKVVAALRERLIPKTKLADADAIQESLTSRTEVHVLELEEPSK